MRVCVCVRVCVRVCVGGGEDKNQRERERVCMIRNTCDCAFTFSEISRAYLLGSESLCQRMDDGVDTVIVSHSS